MNSPIQSEQRLCIDVHDLEHQLSFVTDECKLLNPVKVSYVHVNGEGHIKIEMAGNPLNESKIPVGLREMEISEEAYQHIVDIAKNGQPSIVEPAKMPNCIMLTPEQVKRAKAYIAQYKFGGNTERGVIELLWEVVGRV